MPPPFSARGPGTPPPRPSPRERSARRGRTRGERPRGADGLRLAAKPDSRETHGQPGPTAARETAAAGSAGTSLPSGAVAAARKMAAPCGSERPANSPLKIPKMEVLSPASPGGLSDGNPSLSDPSTPRGASPLGPGSAAGSGAAPSGGLGLGLGGRSAASSWGAPAAACRGMSWTPAETNALIAVWGNERLVEARYQQLEGAGTVFGSKAPGPAMYERVSRALAELGYERTPSQCRERIKVTGRPARGSEPVAERRRGADLGGGAGPQSGLSPEPGGLLASLRLFLLSLGRGCFPDGRQPVGFLNLKLGVPAAAPLSCQWKTFLRSEVGGFSLCAVGIPEPGRLSPHRRGLALFQAEGAPRQRLTGTGLKKSSKRGGGGPPVSEFSNKCSGRAIRKAPSDDWPLCQWSSNLSYEGQVKTVDALENWKGSIGAR